jgi:hypothetical protein
LTLVPAQQLSPRKNHSGKQISQPSQLKPNTYTIINRIQVGDTIRYLKVINIRGKVFIVKPDTTTNITTGDIIKLMEHPIEIDNNEKIRLGKMLLSNNNTNILGYAIETSKGYYITQRNPSSVFPIEISLVANDVDYNYPNYNELDMIIYPITDLNNINDPEVNNIYDNIRKDEEIKCQDFLSYTKTTIGTLSSELDKFIKQQKKLFDKLHKVINEFESVQNEYNDIELDDRDRENLELLTKTLHDRHRIMIDLIRNCQTISNITTYLNYSISNIESCNRAISKVFENIEYAVKDK